MKRTDNSVWKMLYKNLFCKHTRVCRPSYLYISIESISECKRSNVIDNAFTRTIERATLRGPLRVLPTRRGRSPVPFWTITILFALFGQADRAYRRRPESPEQAYTGTGCSCWNFYERRARRKIRARERGQTFFRECHAESAIHLAALFSPSYLPHRLTSFPLCASLSRFIPPLSLAAVRSDAIHVKNLPRVTDSFSSSISFLTVNVLPPWTISRTPSSESRETRRGEVGSLLDEYTRRAQLSWNWNKFTMKRQNFKFKSFKIVYFIVKNYTKLFLS